MTVWRIAIWAAIMIAALAFIYAVRSILLPFILAFVIAALLAPIRDRLRGQGRSPFFSWFLPYFLFFGLLGTALAVLFPVVSNQIAGFKDQAEEIVSSVAKPDESTNFFLRNNPEFRLRKARKDMVDQVLDAQAPLLTRLNLPTSKRGLYLQYVEPQRGQISKSIQTFLTSFLGIATGLISQVLMLVFVPLLVAFILPNTEQLRKKSLSLVPPSLRSSSSGLVDDLGEVFSSYLRGVAIAVFGYMAFMSVLLTILGAPYALLLGVLFGIVYLIPYLNVLISASVLVAVTALSGKTGTFFMHLSSPFSYALFVLMVYLICHFVFDSAIYPRFVGKAVGLDPIVSMFVIFSGGALFGLPGMILAFPCAGAVKVILDRILAVTNKTESEFSLPVVPLRHRSESS